MKVCSFLTLFSATIYIATCDVHLYVSPRGADSNDGHSPTTPVKTVGKALAISAQSIFKNQTAYIELMQGRHYMDRTLVIARANTVIRSYNHQVAHLNGGISIPSGHVKPVTNPNILARLPVNGRAHVRVVNLTSLNIKNFGIMDEYGAGRRRSSPLEVFFNGKALHLARWPNNDYVDITGVPDGRQGTRFQYNSTVPNTWHNESHPWAYGFWYYGWTDRALKIKTMDTRNGMVTLEHKTPRGLKTGHLHQFRNGKSNIEGGYFYFMNILSALDEPGEFYMDIDSGLLYLWVPNQDGNVKSTDLLHISKINDCILVRSEYVRLEDFTVEVCRRSGIYTPHTKHLKIYNLEIKNTGGSGIVVNPDSRDCEISRCYIHDTCGGIVIYGGNRHNLESSGIVVSNNEIVDYSRVGAIGLFGIQVSGVGLTVANNHVYNGGNGAITFSGNDMTIDHNLLHHVCTETASCAAIRGSNDWTNRGNKINYNIVHHVLNLVPGNTNFAIDLDAQLSGTSVMYNVLYENSVHVAIFGGRYNTVENNVMYNATFSAIRVDNRGISHRGDSHLLKALHAMPYKNGTWSLRYPHLANIDNENASLPEGNEIVKNIIYAPPHTEYHHGVSSLLKPQLPRYFNFSQTGFSAGTNDHYNVAVGDFRLRCQAAQWANRVNFRQPPNPNSVGPNASPIGPVFLQRGRVHLVNESYASSACENGYHAPRNDTPRVPYLPDGSYHNDLYPVEGIGCWLNVTKCRGHPASVGTYRDMYGERYHNASISEQLCFKRAFEQWKFCGSHHDELVAAIYGPTGSTSLGGSGCVSASYGCPKHGGPHKTVNGILTGYYFHDRQAERAHSEAKCLEHVNSYWKYCGSNENYPVTNIYLPTGAKNTAGGGCWISMYKCVAHSNIEQYFYDDFGSTNYQTDTSEFACLFRAEYYWHYCGSDPKYPVTASFRRTSTSKTYP